MFDSSLQILFRARKIQGGLSGTFRDARLADVWHQPKRLGHRINHRFAHEVRREGEHDSQCRHWALQGNKKAPSSSCEKGLTDFRQPPSHLSLPSREARDGGEELAPSPLGPLIFGGTAGRLPWLRRASPSATLDESASRGI